MQETVQEQVPEAAVSANDIWPRTGLNVRDSLIKLISAQQASMDRNSAYYFLLNIPSFSSCGILLLGN
jgi:hypothetical protein